MRTLIAAPTVLVMTVVLGTAVILAKLLGVPHRPGGFYERAPIWWARTILWVSGVRVVVHGAERLADGDAHIFVSNHVSWYDVLALAAVLPRYSFVAKSEVFRVPIFGTAALAVGTISIQRDNRKAAFQSYEEAGERIRAGRNVVVYPEGTRGETYALRPFKKGPFVLAIAAGVPIIPTLVHGTIEALPRGSLWLRARQVDVHLLDPVPTAGLDYDERDALSRAVYDRMAEGFRRLYGIESPAYPGSPTPAIPSHSTPAVAGD
jgi:1-acyl-sn-glycerol-3-phosphate acyltransferase